jgi:hypothetical protein
MFKCRIAQPIQALPANACSSPAAPRASAQALVRRFTQQQAKVTFVDQNSEQGTDLVRELDDIPDFIHLDITDTQALQSAIGDANKGRATGRPHKQCSQRYATKSSRCGRGKLARLYGR